MRFLQAWASDRNRLFLDPVYSLKLGLLSGRLNGFVTSDRKLCFEKLQETMKSSHCDDFRSMRSWFNIRNHEYFTSHPTKNLRDLQFSAAANWNVVQVLHASLDGHGLAHLHHGGALLCLQELDSCHVTYEK
jgi:hypothetical protein